jgi:hypothetical protein
VTRSPREHVCRGAGRKYPIYVVIHPTLRALRKVIAGTRVRAGVWEKQNGAGRLEVHLFPGNTLDEVAHEAVHLAFALRRRGCQKWYERSGGDEEESLAYPVGDITFWLWRLIPQGGDLCPKTKTRAKRTSRARRKAASHKSM